MAAAPHEELQYLHLVKKILETGDVRPDRTGTGTISLFSPPNLNFSLSRPSPPSSDPASTSSSSSEATLVLPLITTKKTFTRAIIEELLWFIKGSTNGKELSDKNVHIWDGNGSREYLDKVGLGHREEGDLGPVYGFQWRHFGAEYKTCHDDYTGQGVDQLAEVIRKIKETPTDRRILLTAWNPSDLGLMALPPCHMFCQFYVHLPKTPTSKPELSCAMYQRSADFGLGVPFNIASYALLTHMIALMTDTVPRTLSLHYGDAHVYRDHEDVLRDVQLTREPYQFPSIEFARTKEEIGTIDGFKLEDFKVVGYKSHPSIVMKMSV
ncbi:hypothetical protein RQP46_006655 [Phenoliferia psychrophenolica]